MKSSQEKDKYKPICPDCKTIAPYLCLPCVLVRIEKAREQERLKLKAELPEKLDKVVDEWYEEADLFVEPKEMNSLKQKLREAVEK